jgi:type III restriction enzyme
VRAFGTQLLCEQVVGRGLRRISYEPNAEGRFDPEYAEVYGVPFSFIPTAGTSPDPSPPKPLHRVRPMDDRSALEMSFPHVVAYRYEMSGELIEAVFNDDSRMALSTADLPTVVELHPIVGQHSTHTLAELEKHRLQEVAFAIAKVTLDRHFKDDEGSERPWLFPQLLAVTRRWLDECVTCKDGTFKQLLLLSQWTHEASERVFRSIARSDGSERRILPILREYDRLGSTRTVDFSTTKSVYPTNPAKSHLNYVVLDSRWEEKLLQALEEMPEVECYVKNDRLGLAIPYTFEGKEASYLPDFIVRIRDGSGEPLNLVVEVTGERRRAKSAKAGTATSLWVPAVNGHGEFGRWAFLEVTDVYDSARLIRAFLVSRRVAVSV